MCKIKSKDIHTAQGIQTIFYNNIKWNTIYKKTESLRHAYETNIVNQIEFKGKKLYHSQYHQNKK